MDIIPLQILLILKMVMQYQIYENSDAFDRLKS